MVVGWGLCGGAACLAVFQAEFRRRDMESALTILSRRDDTMAGAADDDHASLLAQRAEPDGYPTRYGGTTGRRYDPVTSDPVSEDSDDDVQDGIKKIEAVTRSWTKRGWSSPT